MDFELLVPYINQLPPAVACFLKMPKLGVIIIFIGQNIIELG